MHHVLYIVQLPNEEDDMHIIEHLVYSDMLCNLNLASSAFHTIPISLSKFQFFKFTCTDIGCSDHFLLWTELGRTSKMENCVIRRLDLVIMR